MNEQGASSVMEAVAQGDVTKLDGLCDWLSKHIELEDRFLPSDLRRLVVQGARSKSGGGLQELISELASRPDSTLVVAYPGIDIGAQITLGFAVVGASADLVPDETRQPEPGLVVKVSERAQGRLGAVRAGLWLHTVLGAISLASYARTGALEPLAASPTTGYAFYSSAGDTVTSLEMVGLRAPGPLTGADLGELFEDKASRQILLDATATEPEDLAQVRLTAAARWLQLASSTLSTAEALMALGIALEVAVGDRQKGAVVEMIAKRSAVFLASMAPEADRADIFFDEFKRGKRLYDLRSRAAHGQYDDRTVDLQMSDASREEFHRYVLDVLLGFRYHARSRNLKSTEDFTKWWKRAEIEGLFA